MSLGYPDGTTVRVPLHHGVFLALIPADCDGPTGLTARDSRGATIAETSKLEISSGC